MRVRWVGGGEQGGRCDLGCATAPPGSPHPPPPPHTHARAHLDLQAAHGACRVVAAVTHRYVLPPPPATAAARDALAVGPQNGCWDVNGLLLLAGGGPIARTQAITRAPTPCLVCEYVYPLALPAPRNVQGAWEGGRADGEEHNYKANTLAPRTPHPAAPPMHLCSPPCLAFPRTHTPRSQSGPLRRVASHAALVTPRCGSRRCRAAPPPSRGDLQGVAEGAARTGDAAPRDHPRPDRHHGL